MCSSDLPRPPPYPPPSPFHSLDAGAPDEDVLHVGDLAVLVKEEEERASVRDGEGARLSGPAGGGGFFFFLFSLTLAVAVTFFSWTFQLSSVSAMSPRYVSPVVSSTWAREEGVCVCGRGRVRESVGSGERRRRRRACLSPFAAEKAHRRFLSPILLPCTHGRPPRGAGGWGRRCLWTSRRRQKKEEDEREMQKGGGEPRRSAAALLSPVHGARVRGSLVHKEGRGQAKHARGGRTRAHTKQERGENARER